MGRLLSAPEGTIKRCLPAVKSANGASNGERLRVGKRGVLGKFHRETGIDGIDASVHLGKLCARSLRCLAIRASCSGVEAAQRTLSAGN
jgi:hypothetical protein